MSDHYRLSAVPDQPKPFVPADEFPDLARKHWTEAKVAFADTFQASYVLHSLLHKPGEVKVLGTVTGALSEAKRMRDAADRLVVELQAIVDAGKATR